MKISGLLLVLGLVSSLPVAAAEEILEAPGIKVSVDTGSGEFRLEQAGRVVLEKARAGAGGKFVRAEWVMLNEPLGAARALQLHYDNQRATLFALFPGRPFLCLRQRLENPGEADVDFEREIVLEAGLPMAEPAGEMRAFGTGGLVGLAKNTGSYMYQAVVHPASGAGLVAGWVSTERASGVFFTPPAGNGRGLQAVSEYGRLRLKPKTAEPGEWLAVGWFADARLGLEAYADMVAVHYGIKLPPQPTGYCTWYSNPHGGAGDEKSTAELAAFCGKELKPYGFSFLQIDDKWQIGKERNGPAKNFTDANSAGPYPAGMKAAADAIKANGLTPGLWFMPFAGDHEDPFFAGKQDWFVKGPGGKVHETSWGGTSLDMSHPGAQEHLRGLVRRFTGEWGMGYLKMDGLYTGLGVAQTYVHEQYKEDGLAKSVFADPYQTNVEIFRRGLRIIREEAGPATYLLGCCIPQNLRSMGAGFGLVDAMRIGPDNEAVWRTGAPGGVLVGPMNGARRWFLHGRVWHNDPDPVYVRPALTLNQARAMASWTAVSGQLNTHSEWTPGLPPERLEILKRTMPAHGLPARPVDIFERDIPRVWTVRSPAVNPGRVVVGLFNWEKSEVEIRMPVARLELDPAVDYEGWEFWSNKRLAAIKGELKMKMEPSSCQVLVLRPRGPAPQVLSTSRNVLQGLLDLTAEAWNSETKTLSGKLLVTANDPAEIRVLLPDDGRNWADGGLVLGEADATAGVRASLARDGAEVRVRLESPESREVGWAIRW